MGIAEPTLNAASSLTFPARRAICTQVPSAVEAVRRARASRASARERAATVAIAGTALAAWIVVVAVLAAGLEAPSLF